MNPRFITEDSRLRRKMYQSDILRHQDEEEFRGPQEEFLKQLDMHLTISTAQEKDLMRASELTIRTHQLNSTGYTYSFEELRSFLSNDHYSLQVAELTDRYGSYGKIGLILAEQSPTLIRLKLLLTSCRVMSRGIGSALLGLLINQALDSGKELEAEFVPTDRNRIMAVTYSLMGFQIHEEKDGVQVMRLTRREHWNAPSHLHIQIE